MEAGALQLVVVSLLAAAEVERVDSVKKRLIAQALAAGERAVTYNPAVVPIASQLSGGSAEGGGGGGGCGEAAASAPPAPVPVPEQCASWTACFHYGLALLAARQPVDATAWLSRALSLHNDHAGVWAAVIIAVSMSRGADAASTICGAAKAHFSSRSDSAKALCVVLSLFLPCPAVIMPPCVLVRVVHGNGCSLTFLDALLSVKLGNVKAAFAQLLESGQALDAAASAHVPRTPDVLALSKRAPFRTRVAVTALCMFSCIAASYGAIDHATAVVMRADELVDKSAKDPVAGSVHSSTGDAQLRASVLYAVRGVSRLLLLLPVLPFTPAGTCDVLAADGMCE